MNIHDFLNRVRDLAPERLASPWDNSGVQVAGPQGPLKKAAVSLEPDPDILAQALDWGARAVVTHHPLYLKPEAPKTPGRHLDILRLLLTKNTWLYAAHTSLDARPDGPARWLGQALGLTGRFVLESVAESRLLAVDAVLPKALPARVLAALAAEPGVRAVLPGPAGLRLFCEEGAWVAAGQRLRDLAPQAAEFFVSRLENPGPQAGFGEIGDLPKALALPVFLKRLQGLLGGRGLTLCGPEPGKVRRVAYCPGSGASLAGLAFARGADLLITGDVKYHAALEAEGLLVDVGHFALEEEMMRRFAGELAQAAPGVEVRFFAGRDPFRRLPGSD